MTIARLELEDKYLDMTVRDLLKYTEENVPQKNMSYHIELSSYGITISKGMNNNDYHTKERHILSRGNKAFDLLTQSKEEMAKSLPYAELTEIQQKRKERVLAGLKLTPTMLETIREMELKDSDYFIKTYGHGYWLSGSLNSTEMALVKRNVGFGRVIVQHFKLFNPLAYMTDEAFSIWNGDTDIDDSMIRKDKE